MEHKISFAYNINGFSGYTISAIQYGHPVLIDVVRIDVPKKVRDAMPNLDLEITHLVQTHLQKAYGPSFPVITAATAE